LWRWLSSSRRRQSNLPQLTILRDPANTLPQPQEVVDVVKVAVERWEDIELGGRMTMKIAGLDRITFDPQIMGGKACIRGMRITVSLILNLVANGMTQEEILKAYPYLEPEDIQQALKYAAWLAEEQVYELVGEEE